VPKTEDNSAYCTLKNWDYGPCIISLDKELDNGGAKATMDVYASFNELENPVIEGSIDSIITVSERQPYNRS
jgi:hypothetical protein